MNAKGKEQPLMAGCEMDIFESLLETQQPKRVLEWGSGFSTVHWPKLFPSIAVWKAIEHDERIWKALSEVVPLNVFLELRVRRDYYWPLLECAGGFDFIFIDGLFRQACMLVARQILNPGGIVVLHDAGRSEYFAAWGVFPNNEVLYRGELLLGPGKGYRHRGLTVFWRDGNVRREGWLRDHQLRSS